MKVVSATDIVLRSNTYLIYAPAGTGKTTAIGSAANCVFEATGKRTLVIDVDRTTRVLKGNANVDILYLDNNARVGDDKDKETGTWNHWSNALKWLMEQKEKGALNYGLIAVDNVSELERCILSDLGSQGKNKGVPAQADYQYMQFKLVNSLRFMKSLDVNIIWTAWETIDEFVSPDGTKFNRKYPKINNKIVDNVCGLCDVVANLVVKSDGTRGFVLEAMPNIYAKNQIDERKGCKHNELIIIK